MDSERIDWISEYGVVRESRAGFLKRIKASLLRRQKRKVRDVNDLDPSDLVEEYNSVFGVDSSDPTAAMRYDLRSKQPESTIAPDIELIVSELADGDTGRSDDIRTETVTEDTVQPQYDSVQESIVTIAAEPARNAVFTCSGEAEALPAGNYNSDAPLTIPEEKPVQNGTEYFTGIKEKYEEAAAEEEPSPEPAVRTGPVTLADFHIFDQAQEFEDVRAEELSGYVDEQIEHELRQTLITDPRYDVQGAPVSAEPVLSRQDKLEVEYETHSSEATETETPVEGDAESAEPDVGPEEVRTEVERIEAPAELPVLGRPLETPVLPLPEGVLSIEAAEEPVLISAPESIPAAEEESEQITVTPESAEPVADFGRAREINAANVAAGRYDKRVASTFEAQILEVESSDASYENKSIQISQVIGGMIIAVQSHADRTVAEESEITDVEPATVEAVAEIPVEKPVVDCSYARDMNAANVASGRYDERAAAIFEAQIQEVEASDAAYETKTVQISQVIGGMIAAVQAHASMVIDEGPVVMETVSEEPVVEQVIEEVAEIPVAEPEVAVDFGRAREINAANVAAGRYDERVASTFEAQIQEVEASGASYEIKSVQVSQVIGGMVIAVQSHADRAVAVEPVVIETEAPVEEPVVEQVIEEIPVAEPEPVVDFTFARNMNAANAGSGRYDEGVASAFEAQIADAETSDMPSSIKSVQMSQIIGGMISAVQAHACMSAAEETIPEPEELELDIPGIDFEEVEYTEPALPEYIAEAAVASEPVAETEPEMPMELRFREMSQIVGEAMLAVQSPAEEPVVKEPVAETYDSVLDAISMIGMPAIEVIAPETETVEEPVVEQAVEEVTAEPFVLEVPQSPAEFEPLPRASSGVSFRFGTSSTVVVGSSGVRFIFGAVLD